MCGLITVQISIDNIKFMMHDVTNELLVLKVIHRLDRNATKPFLLLNNIICMSNCVQSPALHGATHTVRDQLRTLYKDYKAMHEYFA